jgi:uncharacterized membrane protein YphA (DoxX/SURF4 family)
MRAKRALTLERTDWHICGYSSFRRKHLTRRRSLMDRRLKAWQLPPRLITGAYFINAGLSKHGADDATAGQLHGFASGTYPFFGKLDAKRFTSLLSTAEIAIGAALVLPVVPAWLAGTGLTAFALGTLGLYLRTPGMRQDGSLRPTQQGIPLAKDAWMVGIGLALMVDEVAERARRS